MLTNKESQGEAVNAVAGQESIRSPGWRELVAWGAAAVAAFHLGYGPAAPWFFMVIYMFCLIRLAKAATARQAFYAGLVVGLLCAAPQMACFWRIFGPGAVALWMVLAFWIGLFVAVARLCLRQWGGVRGA